MLYSHSAAGGRDEAFNLSVPPAGVVVSVVRLELLEAVSGLLLERFLWPWKAFLASRGCELDAQPKDAVWVQRLHRIVNAVDSEMPSDLQQALLDVADLATESAHEQVLEVARHNQLELFKINARTTPEDLAFEVYLDHRELFRAAHVRTQSAAVERYVEYLGRSAALPKDCHSRGKQALLARALSASFRERNRTGYCHVQLDETEQELRFLVIHGQAPCSHGAIETDDRRGRVTYVRDKHDLVVYQKCGQRLLVNAQYACEQDLYRRLFGRIFWDDEHHFCVAPIYTGQPLLEQGAASLRSHGVRGLQKAVLRHIQFESEAQAHSIDWHGRDLGELLDTPFGRMLRREGDVTAFQLDLLLYGHRRPLAVNVRVPNRVKFDRRRGTDVVEEYLKEAGFMQVNESIAS